MTNLRLVSPTAEPLGDTEREELLRRSDVLLAIATLNPDGSPHVVPMWFLWRDGCFWLTCRREGRVKIRNLERDPRVYFSVFTSTMPYLALSGPASAEVVEEEELVAEIAAEIRRKYLGDEVARQWGEALVRSGGKQVLIKVRPGRLLAWKIP